MENDLDILEIMRARHATRQYLDEPLSEDETQVIHRLLTSTNNESGLSLRLGDEKTESFASVLGSVCYGRFSGVNNYIALSGIPSEDELEKLGYFGEKVVLELTRLGLGTCWVGGVIPADGEQIQAEPAERLTMVILVGHAKRPGRAHPSKTVEELAILSHGLQEIPTWFSRGMEAVALAPSSLNSQKTRIELVNDDAFEIRVHRGGEHFDMVNAAIARAHFTLAVPGVHVLS